MTSVLEDNFPGIFVKLRISFPKFHQCRQETTHAGLEKGEDRSQAARMYWPLQNVINGHIQYLVAHALNGSKDRESCSLGVDLSIHSGRAQI